jgi:hypothetical protein
MGSETLRFHLELIERPDGKLEWAEGPECAEGEPMMHGDELYRWCSTHQQLMMTCEAAAPPKESSDG